MRFDTRFTLVLALLLAAGCAKPVAPVVGRSGADAASVVSDARAAAAGRAFTVRLEFVGDVVTLDRAYQPRVRHDVVFYVTPPTPGATGMDTVPAFSVLKQIQWRPAARAIARPGEPAPEPLARDTSRVFAPGIHEIVLDAPPRAGGGTVTVRFFVGFAPSTWWAGPDPARWPRSSDGDGRAVDVTDWVRFTTVPAWPPDGRRYFGPDSFRTLPSQRRPVGDDLDRRTFYEIYGDRIYARSEGDTVHLNSWIAFANGGFDRDSRYLPRVVAGDPALPPDFESSPALFPVLLPQGLVGSPIGFRAQLSTRLPDGTVARSATGGTYPVFDPGSVFRLPQVSGYWRAVFPGKGYLLVRAVDADGIIDPAPADPVRLADLVDSGGGTEADRLLRRRILTFTVR